MGEQNTGFEIKALNTGKKQLQESQEFNKRNTFILDAGHLHA